MISFELNNLSSRKWIGIWKTDGGYGPWWAFILRIEYLWVFTTWLNNTGALRGVKFHVLFYRTLRYVLWTTQGAHNILKGLLIRFHRNRTFLLESCGNQAAPAGSSIVLCFMRPSNFLIKRSLSSSWWACRIMSKVRFSCTKGKDFIYPLFFSVPWVVRRAYRRVRK